MLNTVYRLVAPGKFDVFFEDIHLGQDEIIIRPTFLSICQADQRYYQGKRESAVLKQKLPMALIHEAVGEVVYSKEDEFGIGQRVVMIPNIPNESNDLIGENYLSTSKFCGSSCDGFMQEYLTLDKRRLVILPENIEGAVASFTEMVSVGVQAITRFQRIAHGKKECIGVWGDGNLSYIISVLLNYYYPDSKIYVMGVNNEKLDYFTFVHKTYNVNDMPEDICVDHAFECVGGAEAQSVFAQIAKCINPGGTVALLGVSEYPIPINTRLILEKGLYFIGNSRSTRKDFLITMEIFRESHEVVSYLSNLAANIIEINSIEDIKKAFENDTHAIFGKTIMIWK